MSLISHVSSNPVSDSLSFLYDVDFQNYAERIRPLLGNATAGNHFSEQIDTNGHPPLVNYVGFKNELDELCIILGAARHGNAWISGPRGSGKTALVEAFLRLRAEQRLDTQLMVRPVFIADVYSFFKMKNEERHQAFDAAVQHVISNKGLLIIDHFDDFITMGGAESGRLTNTLIAALEQGKESKAIIISESDHRDSIKQISTGIDRLFQRLDLDTEIGFKELEPILVSHFRSLEIQHNVDFSEESAKEIIRLLSRYPGRAFPGVRPGNAVAFADKVGTTVRVNKYAEPPELAELREQSTRLSDRIAVFFPADPSEEALLNSLKKDLQDIQSRFVSADKTWRELFAPLFKAQAMLADNEKKRAELSVKKDRNEQEEKKYSLYKDIRKGLLEEINQIERNTSAIPPRVTTAHIRQVFSAESGVPVSNLSQDKLKRLSALRPYLDSEIFLQDDAKRALAKAYTEREMGVSDPSRPAGVLMFTGGTGLGKTELVKVLMHYDSGNDSEPVIIRLSEFKGETATKKLLGADPGYAGYDAGSPFLDPIEKNSRAIVLLDEADKAHSSVFDILMQVLEEGKIRNSQGKLIDFKDTIIIIATNALCAEDMKPEDINNPSKIREMLSQVPNNENPMEKMFRPEFIARIDEVVLFQNLGNPELIKIFRKEIERVNRDYRDRGLSIFVDDETAAKLIELSPSKSGRGPRMIVKEHIRPKLANTLMECLQLEGAQDKPLNEAFKVTFDGKTVALKPITDAAEPSMPGDVSAKSKNPRSGGPTG